MFESEVIQVNGESVMLTMNHRTYTQLDKAHFKGGGAEVAGNFHKWDYIEHLLKDREVMFELLEIIEEIISENDLGEWSTEIYCSEKVGWTWIDDEEHYNRKDLEEFRFEKSDAVVLRVKPSKKEILCPLTDVLTIVFEYKIERSVKTIEITPIYPGPDFGEFDGNITEEEGLIFFELGHPGRPMCESLP